MKQTAILVSLVFVFLLSCNGGKQRDKRELVSEMDSLRSEIRDLKTQIQQMQAPPETALQTKQVTPSDTFPETEIKKPPPKETVKKEKIPVKKPVAENDTVYHRYTNGKLSVKITPWKDGIRQLFFYDLYGEETFRLEDVRMSYSVLTTLSFHPNGAASKAEISTNPGASRYWYESTITFSTTNEPLLKYDRQLPAERIDMEEMKPMFWNKRTRQWERQEIAEEQPVPEK